MRDDTRRGSDGACTRGERAAWMSACPLPAWVRRLGLAAVVFFLIKGLLWLAIPAGFVAWRWWGE